MKTVAIYARVSTQDRQDINTQLLPLREYCTRMYYKVYKEYTDVGQSGAKESRPAFDKLLEDLRTGKFNTVLVYKLDRIGRSVIHLLNLFTEFKNKKIDFISYSQQIDTTTPEGRMFLQILMVLAEYERELIRSRVMDGLKRAKAQGKTLGRPAGSKDKKVRRKSGYYARYANK